MLRGSAYAGFGVNIPPTINVVDVTTGGDTAEGTSRSVALPSSCVTGQRLVLIIGSKGDGIGFPAGWTESADNDDGSSANLAIAYRDCDGSEGASITVTSSSSVGLAWIIYRFSKLDQTVAPSLAAEANNSDANPNSAAVTPSWGALDTVWISAFAAAKDPAATVSVYPSGYTENQTYVAATNSGLKGYVGAAIRRLNATSDNPGAFTISASDAWEAMTIAIKPIS